MEPALVRQDPTLLAVVSRHIRFIGAICLCAAIVVLLRSCANWPNVTLTESIRCYGWAIHHENPALLLERLVAIRDKVVATDVPVESLVVTLCQPTLGCEARFHLILAITGSCEPETAASFLASLMVAGPPKDRIDQEFYAPTPQLYHGVCGDSHCLRQIAANLITRIPARRLSESEFRLYLTALHEVGCPDYFNFSPHPHQAVCAALGILYGSVPDEPGPVRSLDLVPENVHLALTALGKVPTVNGIGFRSAQQALAYVDYVDPAVITAEQRSWLQHQSCGPKVR